MKHIFKFLFVISFFIFSCSKKEGCQDESATNFDFNAEKQCDNCCEYDTLSNNSLTNIEKLVNNKWFQSINEFTNYSCSTDSITYSQIDTFPEPRIYYIEFLQGGQGDAFSEDGPLTFEWSENSSSSVSVFFNGDTVVLDIVSISEDELVFTHERNNCLVDPSANNYTITIEKYIKE